MTWKSLAAALCLAWLACMPPAMAADAPVDGVQVLRDAELTVRLRGGGELATSRITLPMHWDVALRRKAGWARIRVEFTVAPEQRGTAQALLISRLGNAYRVRLNNAVLAEGGEMEVPNHGWTGRRPLWIRLPAPLLQPVNVLDITVRADYLRRAGVSAIQVGPEPVLREAWHAAEWSHVTLPRAVSIFCLLVSGFCLLLWQQQREALYGLAALWQATWSVRIAMQWWEDIFLAWPDWFRLAQLMFVAGCIAGYGLVRAVWAGRPAWEQRAALAIFALGFAAPWLVSDAVLGFTALAVIGWAVLCLRLAWQTWQAPSAARVWTTLAVVVCWIAFVRDVAIARLSPGRFEDVGWTMGAAALSGIAVLAIVGLRFQNTRRELAELTRSLAGRIESREAELAVRHAELRRLERASDKAEERARILRDMHDGAGSHLITAMRQIEGGTATSAEVMQTLRESLDQLRLSVDAMSLPPGDVNALLASLRFRLQPRIEAAGMSLRWEVDPLALWPQASEEAMHHLQYILFEGISNALQHAGARELTLRARERPGAICIELLDDGVGLRGGAGNGLRTMEERAALIGATFELGPGQTGTRLALTLAA